MKYSEWLDYWLADKRKRTKIATYTVYETHIVKQIKPQLGDFLVEEITEKEVQDTIDYWQTQGNLISNKGLAAKSILCLVSIIRTSLYAYYKKNNKPAPVFDLVLPAKMRVRALEVLDTEEQKKIVKAIFKNITPQNTSIAFGLLCGMRVGEVCAIQWRDLDLDKQVVSVSKTVQRVYERSSQSNHSYVVINTPKSATSIRQIPITATLMNLLMVIKPEGNNIDEIYVVTGRMTPTEPQSLNNHFQSLLRRLGMPRRSFHCLRHSFATKWISLGLDVKKLSQILGHSSVETTYDIYVHPSMEDLHREARHFEKLWLL